MTIDVGLTTGIKRLRQQEALFDYTIQVGSHEIPVHKTIMAAVSDYFQVMLTGSLLETKTNKVELKGESVEAVSKLIELIYTGDENIVNNNAMEILGSAVYLQMTFVIQACVDSLLDNLTDKNCLEVLSLFVRYSMDKEVKKVKKFLNSNCKSAVEYCKHRSTPFEVVKIVTECWGQCEWGKQEWDLFLFLKFWVNVNYEERKVHVNDLMSQVRFSLMEQGQIEAIREMDMFTSSEDPWCNLLQKAMEYLIKSIPQRVLDTSNQSRKRVPAMPVVFTTGMKNPEVFHILQRENEWEKHEAQHPPSISTFFCATEVNNFLIVCGGNDEDQKWYIFDPRSKTWAQTASMHSIKTGFALVHCGTMLYALGGHNGLHKDTTQKPKLITRGVEMYDYHINHWYIINEMPTAVMRHSACAFGHFIYVSGGWNGQIDRPFLKSSTELNCLDVRTGAWEKKATMPHGMMDHKMHVMTLHEEKVLVAIDEDCRPIYYQPTTNQWSKYIPRFPDPSYEPAYEWEHESVILAKGNAFFFINILHEEEVQEDYVDYELGGWVHPDTVDRDPIFVEWKFSQTGNTVSETEFVGFISYEKPYEPDRKMFCGLLSL